MLVYWSMPTVRFKFVNICDRNWRVMINRRCHMYAIIATGGKQYKVSERYHYIEKLGVEAGEKVTL